MSPLQRQGLNRGKVDPGGVGARGHTPRGAPPAGVAAAPQKLSFVVAPGRISE